MVYKDFLKKIANRILDIFAPQDPLVTKIEQMSASHFVASATPSSPLPPNTHATALFSYKDMLVKTAIWEVKYRCNTKIAKLLAEIIYDHLLEELSEKKLFGKDQKIILIPVPMHWRRRLKRGFNQTTIIAEKLARLDNERNFTYSPSLVKKSRETKRQTGGSRSERLKNIEGSFVVTKPLSLKNKDVIILDDVYTTGATVSELMKTLRSNGAHTVDAIVIAH